MKTKLNAQTKTAIIILALTGLATATLTVQSLLAHPDTPWYVTYSAFSPFPGPAFLTCYMAIAHHDWLAFGISLVGGLLGGLFLFAGLTRSHA